MNGPILVGLDGSEAQAAVLDEAMRLARSLDTKLILLRAVTLPRELPREALAVSPDEVGALVMRQARAELERARDALPSGLVAKLRVDYGTPWSAIVEAAREERVGMIVIGSHGYGGIDRLLGTTAAKVVNHADRSVLVVRSSAAR